MGNHEFNAIGYATEDPHNPGEFLRPNRGNSEVALVPVGQEEQIRGLALPESFNRTPIAGAPIFIGHHWFKGQPRIESGKLACLDWSAAAGGPLVAYRWDGEDVLSNENLQNPNLSDAMGPTSMTTFS